MSLSLKMLEFWKSTADPEFAEFADRMQRNEVTEDNRMVSNTAQGQSGTGRLLRRGFTHLHVQSNFQIRYFF